MYNPQQRKKNTILPPTPYTWAGVHFTIFTQTQFYTIYYTSIIAKNICRLTSPLPYLTMFCFCISAILQNSKQAFKTPFCLLNSQKNCVSVENSKRICAIRNTGFKGWY